MIAQYWRKTLSHQKFIFFVLAILTYRLVFSMTIGLIDDEAYHWTWSQDLQWSYFDHPGMIAWLEKISTTLFGSTFLGVRLPTILSFTAVLVGLWKLSCDFFGEVAARWLVLIVLLVPLYGIGGYVASPEPPFVCCWVWAAWVFWQGVREDDKRWSTKKTWLCLGILMGLGLNSKFIMAMLAPGFGIYLLASPRSRRQLLTVWPWVGFLIATILCFPIFYWNQKMGWPGFIYQFHDRHQGEHFSLTRWLQWWTVQWVFLTPVPYVLAIYSLYLGFKKFTDPRWRFIFCLAIPSIFIFTLQPFFAEFKPHWPGPAYLFLLLGASSLMPSKKLYWWTFGFLIALNTLIYSFFWSPWLPQLARKIKPSIEWKTTYDLSNEFYGWKEIGLDVLRQKRFMKVETNQNVFVGALRYETTAQTWWGTGEPVFHLSHQVTHYTVMQNYRKSLDSLKGQNAVILTSEKYADNPMDRAVFDRCTSEIFPFSRGQEKSREFTLWKCWNFQGLK